MPAPEIARTAAWDEADAPGDWQPVERSFRDGHTERWWALAVTVGPYGPGKRHRAVSATTDPATLPEHATWYLLTTLLAPGVAPAAAADLPVAAVAEVVRLYGVRNWVEQGDKQVIQTGQRCTGLECGSGAPGPCHPAALGSGVRCFRVLLVGGQSRPSRGRVGSHGRRTRHTDGRGGKQPAASPGPPARRPQVSWPVARRRGRAWLEPWIMLARSWRGWSPPPPPPALPAVLDRVGGGRPLQLYDSS